MFKKIFLGAAFMGLIALLVIGGIRRTQEKLTQTTTTGDHETGDNHDIDGETAVDEWQTVTATVSDVRANGLWLQLENGETIRLQRQPWVYAQKQGFSAQAGDTVRLTGYTNADGFQICTAHSPASGQKIRLRDENGRSLWGNHD